MKSEFILADMNKEKDCDKLTPKRLLKSLQNTELI